jgi:hypothetical protein
VNHSTVPREDTMELLKAFNRPLHRTLRRELKDVIAVHQDDGHYEELVTALRAFTDRYELLADQPSKDGSDENSEVMKDEVELVAYLDLG